MLETQGILSVIMESRNQIQDGRGIQMVDIIKARGYLKSLVVSHMRGEAEPRLWFPDLILGAYGDMLCENELPEPWVDA